MPNIINDKLLPWRMAQARRAIMKPLEIVSEAFQGWLKTWWDVYAPQGNPKQEKK